MAPKLEMVEPYRSLRLREAEATAERAAFEVPLAGNRNDKGTAFGGSLYSAMVLAGWRLCEKTAAAMGLTGDIVVKDSRIEFLRPAAADVTAVATHAQAPERTKHGNLAFEVTAQTCDADGRPCATMRATYRLITASGRRRARTTDRPD